MRKQCSAGEGRGKARRPAGRIWQLNLHLGHFHLTAGALALISGIRMSARTLGFIKASWIWNDAGRLASGYWGRCTVCTRLGKSHRLEVYSLSLFTSPDFGLQFWVFNPLLAIHNCGDL